MIGCFNYLFLVSCFFFETSCSGRKHKKKGRAKVAAPNGLYVGVSQSGLGLRGAWFAATFQKESANVIKSLVFRIQRLPTNESYNPHWQWLEFRAFEVPFTMEGNKIVVSEIRALEISFEYSPYKWIDSSGLSFKLSFDAETNRIYVGGLIDEDDMEFQSLRVKLNPSGSEEVVEISDIICDSMDVEDVKESIRNQTVSANLRSVYMAALRYRVSYFVGSKAVDVPGKAPSVIILKEEFNTIDLYGLHIDTAYLARDIYRYRQVHDQVCHDGHCRYVLMLNAEYVEEESQNPSERVLTVAFPNGRAKVIFSDENRRARFIYQHADFPPVHFLLIHTRDFNFMINAKTELLAYRTSIDNSNN